MRRMLAVLVLFLACGGTVAQAGISVVGSGAGGDAGAGGSTSAAVPGIACSAPGAPPGLGSGVMTMQEVAERLRSAPAPLRVGHVRTEPGTVPTLRVDVIRPDDFPDWGAVWFEAVAHPAGAAPEASRLVRGRVLPPHPEPDVTTVTAEFPGLAGGFWPTRWDIHVLVCSDRDWSPESGRENMRELRAHARTSFHVSNAQVSTAAALAIVVALHLLLALTAGEAHRAQYVRARDLGLIHGGPRLAFALQLPVILQDRAGRFSLARFQGLLFVAALAAVFAYVPVRTGEVPELGLNTFALLGAVFLGSLLAGVAEPQHGAGAPDSPPRLPLWRDLVADEGSIDVTRVLGLLAGLVGAAALVAAGTSGDAAVLVPDSILLLVAIGQAIFVAGRLLERSRAQPAPPAAAPARRQEADAAAPGPMIFVSYRREDSAGWVGRLAADLSDRFGRDNVFQDLHSIGPGVDFLDAIETRLRRTDCVLAVIGPAWLTAPARTGGVRRIDEPDDFVRLEIALALRGGLRVVPVLVGGATMPQAAQLPEDLRALARRNAAELSDKRWDYDFDQLARAIATRG